VSRLTLTITGEGAITGIEIDEPDGAVTRFSFTGEQPNAVVGAESFRFTPPPGVPVVDALRRANRACPHRRPKAKIMAAQQNECTLEAKRSTHGACGDCGVGAIGGRWRGCLSRRPT